MALYEHVFIARQDISADQAQALGKSFAEVLSEQKGKIVKTEYWGLKSLAYRVKKNRKGHYILMNIDASPDAVAEMERRQRLHDDVLRFLTISVDKHEEGPSAPMRKRESRPGDMEQEAEL
ncbi:MAG: 30S ribosomal protein S6 [Parvibaculales bacterium]